ncbi:MAG: hypothetical protein ABEJ83_00535 [Candidatus Nanohaloarchaea archaeon]
MLTCKGSGREGSVLPEHIICIAVFVLVLSLFFSQVNVGKMVGQGLSRDAAKVDVRKIASSMQMMSSEGSAVKKIGLNNDYDTVQLMNGKVVLRGDFKDSPVTWKYPERFNAYGSSSGEGSSGAIAAKDVVCLEKKGMTFRLGSTPCELDTCSSGTCSAHKVGGAPVYGYTCKNGVYTSENFYTRYYSSAESGCGPSMQGQEFAQVNRFFCPDTVKKGSNYGCYGEVTWNCSEGAGKMHMWVKKDGATVESRSIQCTSIITHSTIKTLLSGSTGEYRIRLNVSTPNIQKTTGKILHVTQ